MCDNERIYRITRGMMNAVVYYSNTNQSKRIAKYIADKLEYPIFDICDIENYDYENLVLAFPVHCQGIPDCVKTFLWKLKAENLTLIATYGKMCRGNALFEIQNKYRHNIVAGAYVPTRHSYLNDEEFISFDKLNGVVDKVLQPSTIVIPKSYKNPFAEFLKYQRGRIGVKIRKNDKCDNCGICTRACDIKAMGNGIVGDRCIRCLKCVYACPNGALEFSLSLSMRLYLKKKKHNELILYI